MATPAPKTKEMEKVIDDQAKVMFGRTRTDAITGDLCVICGKVITGFKDAISAREYRISGMCQECQDSVFG